MFTRIALIVLFVAVLATTAPFASHLPRVEKGTHDYRYHNWKCTASSASHEWYGGKYHCSDQEQDT